MGRTPLHVAVLENNIELITDLVNNGNDPNLMDDYGMTALHLAVEMRNFRDTDSEPRSSIRLEPGNSPLYMAIKSGDLDILKLFLDAMRGSNPKKFVEYTPLHLAAEWGNSEIVKVLLKAGADVEAEDEYGLTPLHWAVESGNLNILRLLIDSNADVNANGDKKYKRTPLHIACETLREWRSHWQDRKNKIPVQVNASNRGANVLRILMQAGANVNQFDGRNRTPLKNFIENYSYIRDYEDESSIMESFKLLIECTDINLVNGIGKHKIITNYLKFSTGPHVISEMEVVYYMGKEMIPKFCLKIIQHVAVLKKLNLNVDESITEAISLNKEYQNHFEKCSEELEEMKKTKLDQCWVTFFDLLVDDEHKLVKYAGNQDLISDFNERVEKFQIYGSWLRINVSEGIDGRKLFDNAINVLCYSLPIFNLNHLIVREIIDTLCEEDWKKLC